MNKITTEKELDDFISENQKVVNLVFEKWRGRSVTKSHAKELEDELRQRLKIVKGIKIIGSDVYVITDKLYLFSIGLIKLNEGMIINNGDYRLYISHTGYKISNEKLPSFKISENVYYLRDD